MQALSRLTSVRGCSTYSLTYSLGCYLAFSLALYYLSRRQGRQGRQGRQAKAGRQARESHAADIIIISLTHCYVLRACVSPVPQSRAVPSCHRQRCSARVQRVQKGAKVGKVRKVGK